MVPRPRSLVPLAVPFGFAIGHAVAYLVSAPGSHGEAADQARHGYVGSVTVIGSALMLVAMGAALLAGARHDDYRPRWRSLAAQLCVTYAVIEVIEHLGVGHGLLEALGAASLWIGLVVQLGVAAALVFVLRAAHRVGAALASARAAVPCRALLSIGTEPVAVACVPLTPIRRRGPPLPAR